MKYNFSEVQAKTLDGTPVKDLAKSLANAIYIATKDLSLVKVAQKIHDGEEVELTVPQSEEIKRIIQDEKYGFFAFVQAALIDFIDNPSKK